MFNVAVTSVPESDLLPIHAPDAMQLVALAVDQLSVDVPPLSIRCGEAESVTVGNGGRTVTTVDCALVPPAPAQLSENVLVSTSAPDGALPEVGFAPPQAPLAVQLVALVELHVRVTPLPESTVASDALNTMVGGGGRTLTATVCDAEPPAPLHASVKLALLTRLPVDVEPEVARAPDQPPDAVHEVAFTDDQVKVADVPFAIEAGDTLSETVGAGAIATLTVRLIEPPGPEQSSVNEVFAWSGPID